MAMEHRGAAAARLVHTQTVAGSIPAGATTSPSQPAERLEAVEATPRSVEIAALKDEFPTASHRRRVEILRRLKAIRKDGRFAAYGPQGVLVADHRGAREGVAYLLDSNTGALRRVTKHKVGNKKERRRARAAAKARAEGAVLASAPISTEQG